MGVRWGSTRRAGRKRAPGITRRDFLGGAAAAPIVAATANLALSADLPDRDTAADLVFILSDDEKRVTVRRVSPIPSVTYRDWSLEAASFGPEAWFDMHAAEYANWDSSAQALKTPNGVLRRRLTVRDVSWGRHVADGRGRPLQMTFVFDRSKAMPWTVGLETNAWSSKTGNPFFHTEPANRLELHSFLGDAAKPPGDPTRPRLIEVLSRERIQFALGNALDEQVSISDQMKVGYNSDLEWVLEPNNKGDRPITAYGGCVGAPAFVEQDERSGRFIVKWEQRKGDEPLETSRRLSAYGLAVWVAPFQATGNGKAPTVTISPPGQDAAPVGDLLIGQVDPSSRLVTEGGANAASVVALFSFADAILDCRLDAGTGTLVPMCTGLPLDDVVISRIRMSAEASQWRDVVIADAGGRRAPPSPDVGGDTGPVTIPTLIGRMDVAPLPIDTAAIVNQDVDGEEAAAAAQRTFVAAQSAALGDRAGVSERTFFLVADRMRGAEEPGDDKAGTAAAATDTLRCLYADVALHGIDTALPDTRDSSLSVAGSHFRFNYVEGGNLPSLVVDEVPWSAPDGYLWLGEPAMEGEFAWLDLGGSTLQARRDHDLVDLRFRFAHLVLGFSLDMNEQGEAVGITRALRPLDPEARQTVVRKQLPERGSDGKLGPEDEIDDRRPILAVEFPPQHVMEEAFYRQELGPLPDPKWPNDSGDLEALLETLRTEPDVEKRTSLRKGIGEKKEAIEAKQPVDPTNPQRPFAELRKVLADETSLPADQRQYFGPYAMSPDAIGVAREWQMRTSDRLLAPIVAKMLVEAAKVQPKNITAWDLRSLLQAEADAEKAFPLYKLWRDAFRAYVIEMHGEASVAAAGDPDKLFAEFINRQRVPTQSDYLPSPELETIFTAAFMKQISGREPYEQLAMARLSGGSLLAFRMNLEAAPGDSFEVNGLPRHPADSPATPGPGVQRFGSMPFTFADLTNWSRHEPHVTKRALKLYEPLVSGSLPPVVGRVASVDDHAILVQQGFNRGGKPSAAHLMEVQANLIKRPKALETRIEIPSRLILSTAQNAIWQSPRKVSRDPQMDTAQEIFDTDPRPDGTLYDAYEPLWTARLVTEDTEPSLRAVWSPDVRPEAIGLVPPGNDGVPRIAGPPPRGPWAPWILRREQVDGVQLHPGKVKHTEELAKSNDPNAPKPPEQSDDDACPVPKSAELISRNPTPTMFERICEIFRIRARYHNQPDLHLFRTSLDAYDRHELVLLSSAYGLPVTGRRRQIGDNDTVGGELVEKSGQFEPGTDFQITDATPDLAYYRPKPLDVSELSLSAIGGFLNHDTNFLPPAPAVTYDGRSLFDGLSIERWQHLIVLGRDVLATVVYSGYLYPLGHKASLVKITERIFVRVRKDLPRGEDFGVKAVLRQRMFVRVSSPTKKFPAVGQPNKGRQWCAEEVTMLTRETPDIVDPTLEIGTQSPGAGLSGRIHLDNEPGLAFWPQTATTEEARFRFEFMLDGRRTKMPLIFVDRIAAKNKNALDALFKYYRGLDEAAWRTARLYGQTLRFAESIKEGDTSFAVDSIVLDVDGRAASDGKNWEGQNDLKTNTGVLEGADQPAFYPVMSSATIHIEQAERMSGSAIGAARARYDGSYVLRGLPRRRGETSSTQAEDNAILAGNAAEVFLFLDMKTPPKMSMGPNGNQSGGVGRPNMDIVALSRSKGILGAQPGKEIYERGPSEAATAYAPWPELLSVAKHFSLPPPQEPKSDGQPPTVAPPSEDKISEVFESFFSADAKLLGVISFQKLMKLLQLTGGVDAMPALKEVVDYGSQVLADLKAGAAGAIDLLHSDILAPLLLLVRRARKEWSSLDHRQVGLQKSALDELKSLLPNFKGTSLRVLYPEIDRGLDSLETALLDAMGETDPIVLVGRLAAVHEAGRQFMRELSRLAANPVERIEQAARGQFDNVAAEIQARIEEYERAAKDFVVALQATKEDIANELRIYLSNQLPWDEIEALRAISKSGEAIFDLSTTALAELGAVKPDLKDVVSQLADGQIEPKAALKAIAVKFLNAAILVAKDTEAGLRNPSIAQRFLDLFNGYTQADRNIVAEAVVEYRLRLERAIPQIAGWIESGKSLPEWGIWVARVRVIVQLVELMRELAKAVGDGRQDRVFSLLVQLGRDYLNIDLLAFKTGIENEIAAKEAQFRAWIETMLGYLVQVATGSLTSNTQIVPKLPSAVTAACIAKLPVENETQAKEVASAIDSLDHFLENLAETAANSFQIAADLATVHGKLPTGAPADRVRSAINAFDTALPVYRTLFCEVLAVVGHAQSAHEELAALSQGQGNPPKMTPERMMEAADRLRVLAAEIAEGMRRIRSECARLFDLLDDHLVVIVAAAGGAFAAEFGTTLKATLEKWDKDASVALRVALSTLFRWTKVVATLASVEVGQLLHSAATIVSSQIPNVLRTEREELAASLETVDDECRELALSISSIELPKPPPAETLKQFLDGNVPGQGTVRQLFMGQTSLARAEKIENALQRVSASYVALLSRASGLPASLAGDALDGPVDKLFGALADGYKEILKVRNDLVEKTKDFRIAGPAIQKALTIEPYIGKWSPQNPEYDKLARENVAVLSLLNPRPSKIISTKRAELQSFLDTISGGNSAVEKIFDNIQQIWDDISRGEFSSLVDIAALRDQVEDLISELVPVKRTLSYALGFDFDGNKIANLSGGVFEPKTPSRFELSMIATIDLIKAEADMKANGRIGPFDVNLLGDTFDAVTLIFDGVDFGFQLGGSPRFDVHYRDFQIGSKLEFVKKLQSYMTPSKDGSGFFIEPMRGRPGILAGYGINLGTIQLGGVAFSNVLLNAAAELPFDGEAALFRFALGRPMAPFLISVPPYGGGGFVAIYADAQGFRGFEASFEFGGVADFSTGPLVARGRLTSGFYIRSMQVELEGRRRTITDIYGTFFVGGEASIWIFSFYASLYVRLGMTGDGEMMGEATFTFSFSMGIVDYDFQVSVSHKREAFGGGGTQSINGDAGVDRSITTRSIQAAGKTNAPNVKANTTPLGEATVADYLAYFDPALLKPEKLQ